MEPITKRKTQSNSINKAIIEAMTDTELYDAINLINEELDYRLTDFLEPTDYCGVKKEG